MEGAGRMEATPTICMTARTSFASQDVVVVAINHRWAQVPEIGTFWDGVTPYISDEGRRACSVVEGGVFDRRVWAFL
jgi:hypothetical protein